MHCRQTDVSGLLYVISVATWMDWILPFLSQGGRSADVVCWEHESGPPARLLSSPRSPVVLLSHHDTLLRDAGYALGRPNVLAQPEPVAWLAHDKRAMAEVAGRVDGLLAIPHLTVAEALEYLSQVISSKVVVKPTDSTEGKGLKIVESSGDLRMLSKSAELSGSLLQPALEGHEYSVNLITDGRVCHIYYPVSKGLNRPFGVHPARRVRTFPAPLPEPASAHIMKLAACYALAIGAKGLLEIEFIESDGDLYFVELNPRLSATLRMSIVSSETNLLSAMSKLLDVGLSSQRFVEPNGHSLEVPLPGGLSSYALGALLRLGNVHISSRITVAAPTTEALGNLCHQVSRILAVDGHARAAASLLAE